MCYFCTQNGGFSELIKGIVALYTPDSRYAGAFLDYNLRKEREKVTVKIFTNDESLWGAANKESFDLLLIDGMCMDEKMEELPGKKAILSRKKFIAKDKKEKDDPKLEYLDLKFLVKSICEELFDKCPRCKKQNDKPEGETKK